jgi:hypothetical protein
VGGRLELAVETVVSAARSVQIERQQASSTQSQISRRIAPRSPLFTTTAALFGLAAEHDSDRCLHWYRKRVRPTEDVQGGDRGS